MFRPLTLYIGLTYAYSKNKDNFARFVGMLSMLGIIIGSVGLILVTSVMNGSEQMQSGMLDYYPQVQITTKTNKLFETNDEIKTKIDRLKGVQMVVPLISSDVILQSDSELALTTMMGIDTNQFDPIQNILSKENLNTLIAGQYHLIMGYDLAQKLDVNVGDKVRLNIPDVSQITPVGRIPSQRLFTLSGLFSVNDDIDNAMIYVNISDARKMMHYAKDEITSWRLFINEPLDIEKFELQSLPADLFYKDWREKKGVFFQAVKMEKNIMTVLISLIIVVAAFNIISSLTLMVMQKQGEIAILKTQGLTTKKIMGIFIIQGASSGIMGAVIGIIVGLALTYNLAAMLSFFDLELAFQPLVKLSQVLHLFIFLVLISIASTLYPAYKAAITNPIEALRYE